MASTERRIRNGTLRWVARYRDPSGIQRSRTFDRKIDAERFLTSVESAKMAGSYIDPALAKLVVGQWSKQWLAGQVHLKPKTRAGYADIVRVHIEPRWANVRLGDVTHSAVQTWVSGLATERSPATVRKIHRVLSLILDAAAQDGRLARNPAAKIKLPRVASAERRYLSHGQVAALADACGVYRLVVLFLAYTGVRWGEMAALRVGRLDLMRRRASIVESVTLVGGRHVSGTPKGHERREVPIPRFLVDDLAALVAGRVPSALVFPGERGGQPLRATNVRRAAMDDAAAALGLGGLTPHELRHTAASLAIAAGADVKVVQQMLGHKSATMTLDLYGHLFPDRLDEVADALDAAARAAASLSLIQERERRDTRDLDQEVIALVSTRRE